MFIIIYNQDRSHDFSNYRVKTNLETCKGCGLCVERCPMEVLKLQEVQGNGRQNKKISLVSLDRCLGCGLCVYRCPTQSLILERRPDIHISPKNVGEWAKRWMEDQMKYFAISE